MQPQRHGLVAADPGIDNLALSSAVPPCAVMYSDKAPTRICHNYAVDSVPQPS